MMALSLRAGLCLAPAPFTRRSLASRAFVATPHSRRSAVVVMAKKKYNFYAIFAPEKVSMTGRHVRGFQLSGVLRVRVVSCRVGGNYDNDAVCGPLPLSDS